MNVALVAYYMILVVAIEYAAVAVAFAIDGKWALAVIYAAFGVSNIGLSFIGAPK